MKELKATAPIVLPNLAYSIAFDPPGHGGMRQMVKMLAASMSRTYFGGDLVVFRNSPQPIFLVQRQGIEEVYIETPGLFGQELANLAMAWKAKARDYLPPLDRYGKVLFVDADSVCLRNVDHLLDGDSWDIRYQTEPGRTNRDGVFNGYFTGTEHGTAGAALRDGVNSGTWAVRAECYTEVMLEWERIMARKMTAESIWREQGAWNRLVLDQVAKNDPKWRAEKFESHEVQFPLHLDKDWKRYKDAAILHCMGGSTREKLEFMYGAFMQKFFFDETMTFLNILEM